MNTDYFKNIIANKILNGTENVPANLYIGLSTSDPATLVTEPTDNNYRRVLITNKFTVDTEGVATNSTGLSFPESSDSWGTLTHYVIYDSLEKGNLLMHGKLPDNYTISTNTVVQIPAYQLQISVV